MGVLFRLRRAARHYLVEDQRGNATIEFVLWLPVLLLFFALIVDASMLFNAQANLTRVVQDANRRFSLGQLDETTIVPWIQARAGTKPGKPPAEVQSKINGDLVIQTQVSVPVGNYMIVGSFDALNNVKLYVRGEMYKEE